MKWHPIPSFRSQKATSLECLNIIIIMLHHFQRRSHKLVYQHESSVQLRYTESAMCRSKVFHRDMDEKRRVWILSCVITRIARFNCWTCRAQCQSASKLPIRQMTGKSASVCEPAKTMKLLPVDHLPFCYLPFPFSHNQTGKRHSLPINTSHHQGRIKQPARILHPRR